MSCFFPTHKQLLRSRPKQTWLLYLLYQDHSNCIKTDV